MTNLSTIEAAVRETVKNGPKLISGMTNDEAVDVAMSVLKGERRLRDVRGLTDDHMEAAYAQGFNFFRAGAYAKAEEIFGFCVTFDPFEDKYWKALGATRFNTKEFAGALNAYINAAKMDVSDPDIVIRIAQCHIGLGDKETAAGALEAAIELADMQPEKFADRKARAEALLKLIAPSEDS